MPLRPARPLPPDPLQRSRFARPPASQDPLRSRTLLQRHLRAMAGGTLWTLHAAFALLGAGKLHAQLPQQKGATLLFYGNSTVERFCEQGHLEAWLQLADPARSLRVRSLAWTGDEVGNRWRAEGYASHLRNLLQAWPAQLVVAGFGMNESFSGADGVAKFQGQWKAFLKHVQRQHPDAQVLLLGPMAMDAKAAPAEVDTTARNRDLSLYCEAIRSVAREHQLRFFDLFTVSKVAFEEADTPLTTNGLHLNEEGSRLMARVLASAIAGEDALARVDSSRVPEIALAASRKAQFVADIVRPKNGVIYYGVRARADEYAAEMPRYHKLIEMAEADLHALVQDPARRLAEFPRPTLSPPPEGKSKPDAVLGVIKPAAEQQKEMTVAEDFALNLFASDEQFPELRNPVQIAFDARGRLWVVTMPSWPHTVPGSLPEDKILVLEDTDRDGKADKCTVFAEGLDAIDGIAFHEEGVVVSAQPRLLLMRDTNRDGHADSVRELLRGIDVTDTHHGGMIQTDPLGQIWFCDGVFHRSQFETPFGPVRGFDATTYRLDPRTGRVQSHWQSITPNPWKMTFDRQGSPFQMYGDGIVLDGLQLTWTPVGAYHPFGHGKVLGYGKGSGAASISSPNFPDAFQDGMASAALLGRYCVSLSKLSAKDGPYAASERLDLVRSENPAFRPVDLAFGMDGALYISDFTSRIIGHAQHPMRDPLWNHERGRIWRVTHTAKPVVSEWPTIEGAPVAELLELLRHPQNLVRDHARIELRKRGPEMLTALKAWVAEISPSAPERAQCVLEALWLLESKGQAMPPLLQSALNAADPMLRVAALQLVREQYARLPEPTAWLEKALQDPHPRVRMAVVNAIALLRPQHAEVQHVLHGYKDENPAVKRMIEDLNLGTRSLKGASIPILELAPETRLGFWQSSRPDGEVFDASSNKALLGGANGTWRTVVHADSPASAMLSVKAGHVDIALNGIQKLSANSMWSSQQQLQFDLAQGPNQIEITFRNVKGSPPSVFLSNPVGERLEGVRAASDPATFSELANAWDRTHSSDPGTVRIQAVPNQLQFSPKQVRVRAGKPVRLLFDNPDPMLHNLVIVKPGSAEEVGILADKMVRHTNAAANSYVPKSSKVLVSSELVEPGAHTELNFTAPAQPGIYPILCTFPGHWRVMRAELLVE